MSSPCRLIAATLLLHALCHTNGYAAENWADPRLHVLDGLELWLDASRTKGSERPPAGDNLDRWLDASGKGRHLAQAEVKARPSLIEVDSLAVVRFDGVDDHFRAVNQAGELESFTVVIVAAPRQNIGAFRGLLALNAKNERDYTSGLTVDLGPAATARFSALNVEGRGFAGASNLRTARNGIWSAAYARRHRGCPSQDSAADGGRPIGRHAASRRAIDKLGGNYCRRPLLQQRRWAAACRRIQSRRYCRSPTLQPATVARRNRGASASTSTRNTPG